MDAAWAKAKLFAGPYRRWSQLSPWDVRCLPRYNQTLSLSHGNLVPCLTRCPYPAEGRTMTGPDHYRLAEELLADRGVLDDVLVGVAQAHATLALAGFVNLIWTHRRTMGPFQSGHGHSGRRHCHGGRFRQPR